ncbi:TPA: tail fiber domain-containing protein [Citrobacter freundii]
MSAGTLTLTNNSAQVSGAWTSFTTELTAGDFIVVTVGGVPYTLPVKTIESNTGLTLVSNFTGPTQSGAAWSAVPRVALNMVTAALVAQSAEALRGLNYDKQNWQQVYSASGMITVKLPDGSSFTGPSWKYLSDKLSSLGNSATRDVGTDYGTVAAGNDTRFETVNGKTGGDISSQISVSGNIYAVNKSVSDPANGTDVSGGSLSSNYIVNGVTRALAGFSGRYKWGEENGYGQLDVALLDGSGNYVRGASYIFSGNGNATANGNWINGGSSEKIKRDIEDIEDPLGKMRQIRACTWRLKTKQGDGRFGIGVLAEGLYEAYPEAKVTAGDIELADGVVVENVLSVQAGDSGVTVAIHHAAILILMDMNESQQEEIKQLKADVDELKKIVSQIVAR